MVRACLRRVVILMGATSRGTGIPENRRPLLWNLLKITPLAALMAALPVMMCPQSTLADNVPGAQVVLDNEPVLTIHAGAFSFSVPERAKVISARIASVARTSNLPAERISVYHGETQSTIALDDLLLMTVTDDDASAAKMPREELAAKNKEKIIKAITDYRERHSFRGFLTGILKTLGATLTLVILLIVLVRLFPRLENKVASLKGTVIRTVRFQSIEILTKERLAGLLITLARLLRNVLVLILLYVYISLVLGFFTCTQGVSERLFGYIATPVIMIWQAVSSYIPNIFFVLVIIVCTYYLIKFTRFFFVEVERRNVSLRGFYPDWAMPTYKIVRFMIIAFAVVMVFPYLPGSDSPAFKGVSVFLGVLLSLGSTSAVANVVAGTIITYMRGFSVGDYIRIADTEGEVIEKNLLVTRVRTTKNVDITIPNSVVLASHITNYSTSHSLILHTGVSIGYNVPWQMVHELLLAAARKTKGILSQPPPFVQQKALNDLAVAYEINAYIESPSGMGMIYSDLHTNIQDTFHAAGVEIMSPAVMALRDGNEAALPPDYPPGSHEPPRQSGTVDAQ